MMIPGLNGNPGPNMGLRGLAYSSVRMAPQ
jgi:hypothetical protein